MGFYYLYLTSKDYQKNENEDKKDEELIPDAPDKIGNVNNSIPPVIKRDHGNNGIVFNVR